MIILAHHKDSMVSDKYFYYLFTILVILYYQYLVALPV